MLVLMSLRKSLPVLLIVAFLCMFCLAGGYRCVLAVGEDDARQAVSSARLNVVTCYSAVVDAERSGANISDLLVTLNEAGGLISQADLAFGKSDFGSAVNFASQSQQLLSGFVDQAQMLRDSAAQKRSWDFLIYVAGPILGAAGVLVASLNVWVFLKRRYREEGDVSA